MYNNILITPESQYSYSKRTHRGHMIFAFKSDKTLFPVLSVPHIAIHDSWQNSDTKKNGGGGDLQNQGRNIFQKPLFAVVQF
jgi:hypothetical protein